MLVASPFVLVFSQYIYIMKQQYLPPLSFSALRASIQNGTVTAEEAESVLNENKEALFEAIKVPRVKPGPEQTIVRYRRNSTLTESFPEPTNAELLHIDSIQNNLGITKSSAAVLLRDFLESTRGRNIAELLKHHTNFVQVAPIERIRLFWREETRAAFSCLAVVFCGASSKENLPLSKSFLSFANAHKETVSHIVQSAVRAVLSSFDTSRTLDPNGLSHIEPWWVMELFFCFTTFTGMTSAQRIETLTEYSHLVKRCRAFESRISSEPQVQPAKAYLDGAEATAFYVAAINQGNHPALFLLDNDLHEHGTVGNLVNDKQVNEAYISLQSFASAEAALLSFSWSSTVRLQKMRNSEEPLSEDPDEAKRHMSFAITSGVLRIMGGLARAGYAEEDSVTSLLFKTFWEDTAAFLTAFPPHDFFPHLVTEVVDLSTGILLRAGENSRERVAERIWECESSSNAFCGPNALLRIASGVFPQTFRPLINLLTTLSVNQETVRRAIVFLEQQLLTITEVSEGYRDILLALDEDDMDIWNSLASLHGPKIEGVSRTLSMVRHSESDSIFVQAGQDLPGDGYRAVLPRGSVGLSDVTRTSVTWIAPWNGLGAINHILRVLLRTISDEEASFLYDDYVLNELLESGISSLRLIDRMCRAGSTALRSHLTQDASHIATVSTLVAEFANPGDRAKRSWLTKSRQEKLLTVSASCLAAMTSGSRGRAYYALEHLESTKGGLPLDAALSALGDAAFPSVSAICHITEACTDGESLNQDIVDLLSSLKGFCKRSNALDSLQRFRGGQTRVHDFLVRVALPLWLSSRDKRETQYSGKNLTWLLPACSLFLFTNYPDAALDRTVISAVIEEVLNAACSEQGTNTDVFLFPALRAGLALCYEALRKRCGILQDQREAHAANFSDEKRYEKSSVQKSEGLCSLEKMLLKPDNIRALSLLSSGGVKRLKHDGFYTKWERSEFRDFLPHPRDERFLIMSAAQGDTAAGRVMSWRVWTEDMGARCLSLLFSCLSVQSSGKDIIQVPWPMRHPSSAAYTPGGGDEIRKGFASRIANDSSVAVVELFVSVISCGQRAAARSLLGPRPDSAGKSLESSLRSMAEVKIGGQVKTLKEDEGNRDKLGGDDFTVPLECEVMTAVVQCLQSSIASWMQETSEETMERTCNEFVSKKAGYFSLTIAACIRFLRVGWESHNSKWFRDCWRDLNVWALLGSLLRCTSSGARASNSVDLERELSFAYFVTESLRYSSTTHSTNKVEERLHEFGLCIDTRSAWKCAVADTLQVFSSEILHKASEGVMSGEKQKKMSLKNDNADVKLPQDIFEQSPFVEFRSVFTELWLNRLLAVDESYISYKQTSDEIMSDNVPSVKPIRLRGNTDEIISAERDAQRISNLIADALKMSDHPARTDRILRRFQRSGDVRMRFGCDYTFDTDHICRLLRSLQVDLDEVRKIVKDVLILNSVLCQRDVQAEIVSSFSAMTSAVLFADSFVPNQSLSLTYSSPQFGGKLCRFLSRVLACIAPSISSSHTRAMSAEFAKLVASLSARLSDDELDHFALTSMKFFECPGSSKWQCSLSPVGQICYVVDLIITSVKDNSYELGNYEKWDTVRWLLLSAARLCPGKAFRDSADIRALTATALSSLRVGGQAPQVCGAASVALAAVMENADDHDISVSFDRSAWQTIFSSIATLSDCRDRKTGILCCETAANLILVTARAQSRTFLLQGSARSAMLRQISSGILQGFLPSERERIPSYETTQESRCAVHMVWCSCLHFSSIFIPDRIGTTGSINDKDQVVRDVLEFSATYLTRIVRDSLDLSGDWPIPSSEKKFGLGGGLMDVQAPKHLTISRVEEAELAASTVSRLSTFALHLQNTLPQLTKKAIEEIVVFTGHVVRLLRSEPVERWVRPVTQREKDRSQLLRYGRESQGGIGQLAVSTPGRIGTPGAGTPPRRSPSQAIRAALGDNRSSHGSVPPSPASSTPLLSPIPGFVTGGESSPGSPWGPYGSGLITEDGGHFGDEVTNSLLRALSSALGALRRFSSILELLLFGSGMMSTDDPPTIGTLLSIQNYATSALMRGAEESRRELLHEIVDSAMHLTITHSMTYIEQSVLTQGVKDELRKRIATYVSRMGKVVPPSSFPRLYQTSEVGHFLRMLREE